MSPSRRTGIVYSFACLIILGVMPLLAEARPAGSDGLTFTVWLTFWQLVASLPLFFAERRGRAKRAIAHARPRPNTRVIAIALFTGAVFGVSTYMYVVAARNAGPVSMAIVLQAYPLFAILLEALFLGKRKTAAELGFTALLIGALYYLTTQGSLRVTDISWWSAFALGIPLLWSIAHILLRQILAETPVTPNQVTVSRLVISGVFLLAVYAVVGDMGTLVAAATDGRFQLAAMLLGLAYYTELVLWFHAMRHIDVSLASSVTVPVPAVTMLISVLLLGGQVETYQVAAMAVIVIALYGLLLAGRRAAAISETA
ncbi:DMT family transporter [Oricola sp.]|uniref:DMT family transporter n=1 Tax=Oricola sp. TaxID=1979950 RepID=UPI0025E7B86D|nr:DMT family transporter [Oricola sp.]MCI5076157.1 DMT family transporter [Oricola sp.]